ncbi:MAG: uncharacterized membrane protein YhaH (DUF805 family) [Saprospiraceae bacterium]|jgi:uncharacterized membrane protein YhaH (DUF805 family)
MDYYKLAFQKFSDFSGRSRRSEYWYFVLFNTLVAIAAITIDMLIWGAPILYGLYALAVIIPSLSLLVRRLHDIGKSGWWFLIAFVPVVGSIVLLVFLVTDSQPGPNQWGNNPKEIGSPDIMDHFVE